MSRPPNIPPPGPTEPSPTLRLLMHERYVNEQVRQQQAAYAAECAAAGGVPVHGASVEGRNPDGSPNGILVTPCGLQWPKVLADSKSRPPEAVNGAAVTCVRCLAVGR